MTLCLSAAVKEAAVQRRHNLYRDSIVLSNSDPNLHLLGETPSIDWAGEFGGAQEDSEDVESQKRRRMKQVVSMIQVDDCVAKSPPSPSVTDLREESAEQVTNGAASPQLNGGPEVEGGGTEEHSDGGAAPFTVPPAPEEEPASSEVVSEEELPPPPPEEVLSAALETSSPEEEEGEESDFPPPPHDDSGFQSPTTETEEGHPGQSSAAAATAS